VWCEQVDVMWERIGTPSPQWRSQTSESTHSAGEAHRNDWGWSCAGRGLLSGRQWPFGPNG
jgi:hypothetical protein